LVDAAHAVGMRELNVNGTKADFWLGNLHKWAFAPRPTALLAVAAEHRTAMRPLVVSWEQSRGFPVAQEFAGTLDYTAWLAAPTGTYLLRTLGLDQVRSHNNALVAQGQRVVASALDAQGMPGLEEALAGRLGSDGVSMRVVPLGAVGDQDAALALRDRLAAEHRIETVIGFWNGTALLRLSAQLYNRAEDYERLAEALTTIR
jgi:isopenicillin-N epimerase